MLRSDRRCQSFARHIPPVPMAYLTVFSFQDYLSLYPHAHTVIGQIVTIREYLLHFRRVWVCLHIRTTLNAIKLNGVRNCRSTVIKVLVTRDCEFIAVLECHQTHLWSRVRRRRRIQVSEVFASAVRYELGLTSRHYSGSLTSTAQPLPRVQPSTNSGRRPWSVHLAEHLRCCLLL